VCKDIGSLMVGCGGPRLCRWQLKMRDLRALIGQFPYLKHNLDREVSQHVLERAGLHPDGVYATRRYVTSCLLSRLVDALAVG
jgi:hypothetical protein